MIGQMQVLLRVKDLKQDQALRTVRTKRGQVEVAKLATERARDVVTESAATLPAREDAIYQDILGQVVDLAAIDATRGRVVVLEAEHGRLKDALERANHVERRLEGELDTATLHYRAAVKVRDKYAIVTDEMKAEADAVANAKEEIEIEDLFARPRKRPA